MDSNCASNAGIIQVRCVQADITAGAGILAPGYTVILEHAVVAAQQGAGMCIDATGGDSRAVIEGLAQVTGAEMRRACQELLRVDELLTHAIAQLMDAFNNVADMAQRQQQDLVLAAAAAQARSDAERLRAEAQRVECNLNAAVTAMQFRDVVGQKLGHVRMELEALEQVMQQIREAPATQAGMAEHTGEAQLVSRVLVLLQQLEQGRPVSPAQQEYMDAGEVELF